MTHSEVSLSDYSPKRELMKVSRIKMKVKKCLCFSCPGASSLYMLTNAQPQGLNYIGEAFCGIINYHITAT